MLALFLALVIVQVAAFRQQCTFTSEQGIAADGKLCGCLCGDFCFASADNELGNHELFRYRVDTGECGTDDRTSRCGRNTGTTIAVPENDNLRIDKQFNESEAFLCRELPVESLRESFFCNSPYNGIDEITLAPVKFSIFPAFSGELFETERVDECCFAEFCNECTPDEDGAAQPVNADLKCSGACANGIDALVQPNRACPEPTFEPTPLSVVEPRADMGCASSFARVTLQLHSCDAAPVQLCFGLNETLSASGELVHIDTWGGDLDALGDLELISTNGTGDYEGRHVASLVQTGGGGVDGAPTNALYHLKLMHIDANRQPVSTIDLHVLQTSNDSVPVAPGAGGVLRFSLQKIAQPQHLRLSQNALLLHPDLGEKERLFRSDVVRDAVLPADCAERKRQLVPSANNSGEFFLDAALPLLEQAETSLLVRLTEASVLPASRKRGHHGHGHRYQGGSSSSGDVDDDDDDSSDARRGCRRAAGESSSSNGRLCFAKDYYVSLHNTGTLPAVALANVTVRVRIDEFDAAFVDEKTSGVIIGARTFVEGPQSELRWLVPQVLPGGVEELRVRVEQTTNAPRLAASVVGDVRGCFAVAGAVAVPCNVQLVLLEGTELQQKLTGSFFLPAQI